MDKFCYLCRCDKNGTTVIITKTSKLLICKKHEKKMIKFLEKNRKEK